MFEPYEKNRLGPVGPDLEQNKSKTKEDNSTQYKGTKVRLDTLYYFKGRKFRGYKLSRVQTFANVVLQN